VRTTFNLSVEEYRELKEKGLDLEVGGRVFTIMVERNSSNPLDDGRQKNGSKPGKPFPEPYPVSLKKKVLKYAKTHMQSETARKFKISATCVSNWLMKQKEGGK